MSRRVKEFVEVADHVSIDDLITSSPKSATACRKTPMPSCGCAATKFSAAESPFAISATQTDEEAEIERRYADAMREAKELELARLQAELGVVCYAAPGKRGKLRIVA